MTDDLLSNRFAHLLEPAAVLKAVHDRGNLGALDGRVFRKLGPEVDPRAEEDEELVETGGRNAKAARRP